MTSATIIEEIKQLSPAGQAEVIQFAVKLAKERPLLANELTDLAQRMAESTDPAEVARLKSAIANGFYGESGHA
jgi:hypothetical protein